MRLVHHPILEFKRGKRITFSFDGREIEAYEGETIAAALHAAGVRALSHTKQGSPRGLFCAIGKCSSCLMTVDGIPNVRACVTPVREGMEVCSQTGPGAIDPGFRPRHRAPAKRRAVEVAIVGAGPAGLSAAHTLLEWGVRPLVVDENPHLGGQLIKQTHKFFGSRAERAGTRGFSIAQALVEEVKGKTEVLREARVVGLYPRDGGRILVVQHGDDLHLVEAQALIVATGAEERFPPFPGNTLPGVYGAGDCAGIGEASTAMLEGRLAALAILGQLGKKIGQARAGTRASLERLRAGPFGTRPRQGKEKLRALLKEVACG